MQFDLDQAQALRDQGQSYRQIATTLGVSKSLVAQRLKRKSLTSPTWVSVSHEQTRPIDLNGTLAPPTRDVLYALNQDTTYSCVKWLSDTVSSVPMRLYVETKPGMKKARCPTRQAVRKHVEHLGNPDDLTEVADHPLKTLLERPNPDMSGTDMVRLIDIDLSICGNSLWWVGRADDGLPESLWPLDPQHIEMARDDDGRFIGWWDKSEGRLAPRFYKGEDVLFWKLVNPADRNGMGYGVVQACYQRILLAMAELGYLSALYRNQARPDSIVSIKGIIAAEAERVQKELNQRFTRGGAHGVWVVDEEVDVKPIGWQPKDLLGTDLYRYSKEQVLNAFGLNMGVFTTENSNRAVAEASLYMANRNAVVPRLRTIEQRINHCLAPEFDARLKVAFDSPLLEDRDQMLKEHVAYLNAGVVTINQVRDQLGMPPVSWGSDPLTRPESPTQAPAMPNA